MDVITEGWPKENQVFLAEITCKYWQNPDCTEDQDGDPQEIEISSRDNGVAKFIHIKTDGWSIDGDNFNNDLIPLLEDFKHRMNDVFICDSKN
jgi:predicted transcriptional regulator